MTEEDSSNLKSPSFRQSCKALKAAVNMLADLEVYKNLNSLSRCMNFFPRFHGEELLLETLIKHLDMGIGLLGCSLQCEKMQFLCGTLANIAVDCSCRMHLIDKTDVLNSLEKLLDVNSVSTQILSRSARLIANLARVEAAAEDMFSTNTVFSLLKHAGDTTHASNFDCTECIVRAVRILTAGRPQLLSMMLNQGGVSTVCRNFSPQSQPLSLQAEILKCLKELCVTNCSMELAGQIKDSGILPNLIDVARLSSTTTEVSVASHTAVKIICEVVQHSIARGILGCTGCVELFFTIIKNTEGQYSNVEVSKSVAGICYLSRECLTRLKMRDQGYLPDLVALLGEQKQKRLFNMILTSLLCFSNDELGLILMVKRGNLLRHLFNLLDEDNFQAVSHPKCNDKCQLKEKHLLQMRPDLFSLDFGTPIEYYKSTAYQRSISCSSTGSPYHAALTSLPGEISPPWSTTTCSPSSNPGAGGSRFMITSPTRSGMGSGSRQWLPFSQSPFLELSPNHFMLSPNYPSSPVSYDFSSANSFTNSVAPEMFSDEEEEDTEDDQNNESGRQQIEGSVNPSKIAEISTIVAENASGSTEEKLELDSNILSVDSGLGVSSFSPVAVSEQSGSAINEEIIPRKRRMSTCGQEPSEKREKRMSESSAISIANECETMKAPNASKTPCVDDKLTGKRILTCAESNVLQLLTKLSMIHETALMLCKSEYTESILNYYAKLNSPNPQLQRVLERLVENVVLFMQLVKNNFVVKLHRRLAKLSPEEEEAMSELISGLVILLQSNAESKYNYSELYNALSNSPIEMQFSVAVSLPFIMKKPEFQKVFFVDHFALDLLVNSFSKTQYLNDEDLQYAVYALRHVINVVSHPKPENSAVDEALLTQNVDSDCDDEKVEIYFDGSEKDLFSRKMLSDSSDVLKVLLNSESGFKEGTQSSVSLKGVKLMDFRIAVMLVQNKEMQPEFSLSFEPYGTLNVMEMYNLLSNCTHPEMVASKFLKLIETSDSEDLFESFVTKTSLMPSMSITSLNLVSIIIFQHLFMTDKYVDEAKCVNYMKALLNLPQFSVLLLECFSEKVVKFYFPK